MTDAISVLDSFIADVGAGRKPGAAVEPEPEPVGYHWSCPKAKCDKTGGPYKTAASSKSAATRHAKTCQN
jgi:hypothetical protein